MIKNKYMFIFLLFFCKNSFCQAQLNNDSIIYYFNNIINDYRLKNNLNKVSLDTTLKNFAQSHSDYMAKIDSVTHGHNEFSFYNRVKRNVYQKNLIMGENCAVVVIPTPGVLDNLKSSIDDLNPLLNKLLKKAPNNYDMALYSFILWKNSKSHNEFLLSPEIKNFYLAYSRNKNVYYFEYVGKN